MLLQSPSERNQLHTSISFHGKFHHPKPVAIIPEHVARPRASYDLHPTPAASNIIQCHHTTPKTARRLSHNTNPSPAYLFKTLPPLPKPPITFLSVFVPSHGSRCDVPSANKAQSTPPTRHLTHLIMQPPFPPPEQGQCTIRRLRPRESLRALSGRQG